LQNIWKERGKDFEECENMIDIYVVPYLVCDGKVENFVNEDGLESPSNDKTNANFEFICDV